ncbi:WYL domain-containing protein [Thermosyntropha lipolytica DSM 11003]|uniref:WYL domain-containing protein n=2 Tax=Thermosyntropha TaxID=54293 RepID=A0A1M5R0J2_9FIRM|nr:WYL domain-containing protein [Thermosyntropha lipolytica DSM 11003]
MRRSKVENISAQTAAIKDYLLQNPYCEEEDLLNNLKISKNTLYRILLGLADDVTVYENDRELKIMRKGSRLTRDDIVKYLEENLYERSLFKKTERLLYLYNLLHSRIPYGGAEMELILKHYKEIMSNYGEELPAESSIKRMIYRDINELEEMGIVINRPSKENRKYALKEVYLPKLPPESAAAVYTSMLLYDNTLLEPVIAAARLELEKSFVRNKKVSHYAENIKNRIYVVGDTLASPERFGDILGKLIKAVTENIKIKIVYMHRDGTEGERWLEPLGMVCKRSVWYLLARKSGKKNSEVRVYRVDQIKSIYLREREVFTYPEDFCLHEYIKASWGIYCNDPVQKVVIKFSPEVAFRLKTIKYHPSQKILTEYADGSLLVEYEVCGLIEMQSWLMQWGENAEVISPESLRIALQERAQKILEKYNG